MEKKPGSQEGFPSTITPRWDRSETELLIVRMVIFVFAACAATVCVVFAVKLPERLPHHALLVGLMYICAIVLSIVTIVESLTLLNNPTSWKKYQVKSRMVKIAATEYPLDCNLGIVREAVARGFAAITVEPGGRPGTVRFPEAVATKMDGSTWRVSPGPVIVVKRDGLVTSVGRMISGLMR